jgi:L-aspartate oxidase
VTTNPLIATGDGLAAAWRAGAEVADLEFVQFHPTALDHDAAPRFLLTEALRGEGAHLLDAEGRRFMLDVHPLAELAPRDVVSRAIERVMIETGRNNVSLDARHLGEEYLRTRFPTIWAACADAGYSLATDLVPVAPAAHYLVGGVRVDIDGRTTVPGLYASGEVTASGLHGANRLASNSLLEGLVFSRRIVRALDADEPAVLPARLSSAAELGASSPEAARVVAALKDVMQGSVGVSRVDSGLVSAAGVLASLAPAIEVGSSRPADLEASNLVTVGTLIAHAAWLRTESRGCHSRLDYPTRDDDSWCVRVVQQRTKPPSVIPVRAEPPRTGAPFATEQ